MQINDPTTTARGLSAFGRMRTIELRAYNHDRATWRVVQESALSLSAFDTFVLAAAASVAGAGMVVVSLVLASLRGQSAWMRFWVPANLLVGKELFLNRGGFALAVAGIAAMFSQSP